MACIQQRNIDNPDTVVEAFPGNATDYVQPPVKLPRDSVPLTRHAVLSPLYEAHGPLSRSYPFAFSCLPECCECELVSDKDVGTLLKRVDPLWKRKMMHEVYAKMDTFFFRRTCQSSFKHHKEHCFI